MNVTIIYFLSKLNVPIIENGVCPKSFLDLLSTQHFLFDNKLSLFDFELLLSGEGGPSSPQSLWGLEKE